MRDCADAEFGYSPAMIRTLVSMTICAAPSLFMDDLADIQFGQTIARGTLDNFLKRLTQRVARIGAAQWVCLANQLGDVKRDGLSILIRLNPPPRALHGG